MKSHGMSTSSGSESHPFSHTCQLFQYKSKSKLLISDYWWLLRTNIHASISTTYTHIIKGDSHQSSVISKYIWWCKILEKRSYIYNIIYIKIFLYIVLRLTISSRKHLITDDWWLRGYLFRGVFLRVSLLGCSFLGSSTVRAPTVYPPRHVGKPSAMHRYTTRARANKNFYSPLISYLQKEETQRNRKKQVSAYAKIKCLTFVSWKQWAMSHELPSGR